MRKVTKESVICSGEKSVPWRGGGLWSNGVGGVSKSRSFCGAHGGRDGTHVSCFRVWVQTWGGVTGCAALSVDGHPGGGVCGRQDMQVRKSRSQGVV